MELPRDPPTASELRDEALEVVADIRGLLDRLHHSLALIATSSTENAAIASHVRNNVHKNVCATLREFTRK
jgi:hypothetical protein